MQEINPQTENTIQPKSQIQQPAPVEIKKTRNWVSISFGILVLALFLLSSYLAYQNMQLQKQIANLNSTSPSPLPLEIPDPTAKWKLIKQENWEFKIPPDWNYWKCSKDLIFAGTSTEINKDQTIECAFDGSPGSIQIYRSIEKYPIPTSSGNDQIVTEKSTITVDGKTAIKQLVTITEGQGTGTRWVIYVENQNYMDTITLHNTKEKEIFDQILTTLKFTDSSSRKEGVLKAVGNYLNALTAENCETASTYLTISAKEQFESIACTKQYKTWEGLSEFHSEKEEVDFYNQSEIVFPIKLYKENDKQGTLVNIKFVMENGSWKTDSWFMY